MSYLKQIRSQCLECMGGSYALVRDCGSESCPLHAFRMGKKSKLATTTALKAIRAFCLECVGTWHEVEQCTGKMISGPDCPFYFYRKGKNPKLKGRATKGSFVSPLQRLI